MNQRKECDLLQENCSQPGKKRIHGSKRIKKTQINKEIIFDAIYQADRQIIVIQVIVFEYIILLEANMKLLALF